MVKITTSGPWTQGGNNSRHADRADTDDGRLDDEGHDGLCTWAIDRLHTVHIGRGWICLYIHQGLAEGKERGGGGAGFGC